MLTTHYFLEVLEYERIKKKCVNVQLHYEKLWKKGDMHIKWVNHAFIVLNII